VKVALLQMAAMNAVCFLNTRFMFEIIKRFERIYKIREDNFLKRGMELWPLNRKIHTTFFIHNRVE
jgi:hypothetical protein